MKDQYYWFDENNGLHKALLFGIGCHHAGLPTKYRHAGKSSNRLVLKKQQQQQQNTMRS
jgi:hypothetical protein